MLRLAEEKLREAKETKKYSKLLQQKTKTVRRRAIDELCFRTLRNRAFEAWKLYYDRKRYLRVKNSYGCNRKARLVMRNVLKEWALVAHTQAGEKKLAFKRAFEKRQRAQFTDALDMKLEHLKLYATQLQEKISEEQESIISIERDYERSVGHGTEVLERETNEMQARNTIVGEINDITTMFGPQQQTIK